MARKARRIIRTMSRQEREEYCQLADRIDREEKDEIIAKARAIIAPMICFALASGSAVTSQPSLASCLAFSTAKVLSGSRRAMSLRTAGIW